ncbi:MAG: hypothetical protein ABI759_29475 [Candidatus Solibacter sp.]
MPVSLLQANDAHGKALSLNLDGAYYGTLAEIGAGQEVARCFLSVGAASGTVAKTISAYDKTVSDEIYGAGTRYVSEGRLSAMLDREYTVLLKRLLGTYGPSKRFFVFADTIAARNYQGTNEQHGWLGIRFQVEPGAEPSQILIHINLRDATARLQQEAVGILGVNLIYAAFHQRSDAGTLLAGLFDKLSVERIEIDVIRLAGPAFAAEDSNQWCLELLSQKMAHGIVFGCSGDCVEPSGVLRKRPLVVMRGTFDSDLVNTGLLQPAKQKLVAEGAALEREPVTVLELTTRHVSRAGSPKVAEMLRRIQALTPSCPVIASDFPETYLLSRYLRRHSTEPVRFVMSIAAAAKIMTASFYEDLPGSLLEGLGKLLGTNVKLYVAAMSRESFLAAMEDMQRPVAIREGAKEMIGLDDLIPVAPVSHLLEYLRTSGRILALTD